MKALISLCRMQMEPAMAIHDFRSQRLFVEEDLACDKAFEARREQANYLMNVLRMKEGDTIAVFNGRDGEWQARLESKGRKKCDLVPVLKIRPQPEPSKLVYCFAPLKQARLDYMIQKAVEMGAGILQPVMTRYTQVRDIKEKRLLANAIEAAEQCGILNLPEIRDAIAIANLLDALGKDTLLIFCDEETHADNPVEQLKSYRSKPDQRIAILIGPEGGFDDEERDLLANQSNVIRLGLGPRILRADTAAVAALAIVQANLGDWYV